MPPDIKAEGADDRVNLHSTCHLRHLSYYSQPTQYILNRCHFIRVIDILTKINLRHFKVLTLTKVPVQRKNHHRISSNILCSISRIRDIYSR